MSIDDAKPEQWDAAARAITGRPREPDNYQVGGDHYQSKGIQPIDYILANNMSYFEGNVIKYVTRHRDKNGSEDIRKAIQYLKFILHKEYKEEL